MNSRTILAAALALVPAVANADIVINEIMQSNIDCIMDDLNDFPDSWVEFYNPDAPVYYDITGRAHSRPVSGVNIVPTPDGARKFIKQ